MANAHIILPNNWTPRDDQLGLWTYLERGGLRADQVAHRRWGKDDVSLHWAARAAHMRVGVYWHMLPEASQARKAIWDAVNPRTGKRRIDEAFPKELRKTTREDQMFIVFKNGSTWQVLGSDNYDSLVGSPPIGCVFSEWSIAKPNAWNYIRPILAENGGWAVFIWTPRGRNHATRAYEARARDPNWWTQKVPAAEPIYGENEHGERAITAFRCLTPVFNSKQLMNELNEMINETGSVEEGTAQFNQEYLVDFDAPVPGSYYGTQMSDAETSGRITLIPHQKQFKVDTAWDLGMDDYTAIWFVQRVAPNRINLIDYYETSGVGFDTIVEEAFAPKRYSWGMHYLPHDVQVRELGAAGRSRRQTLHVLGIKPIRVGIARKPEERINAMRKLLPFCYFDRLHTQVGVDHLKQYRKSWNQSMQKFMGPLHDEHSHAADAAGEFAVNARMPTKTIKETQRNPIDRYSRRQLAVPHWKTL